MQPLNGPFSTGAPYVDAQGQWLDQPEALMKGTLGGQPADSLLLLSRPAYNETDMVRPQLSPLSSFSPWAHPDRGKKGRR